MVRTSPKCPFCGAPTRPQAFRERAAYVCTDCGGLCIGPEVAGEMFLAIAATPVAALPRQRAAPSASDDRRTAAITLAVALVVLLLAIPVAVTVFDVVRSRRGRVAYEPDRVPPPARILAPPPEPVEVPGALVAEAAPEPPPAAGSYQEAIALGWQRVDLDPRGAEAAFQRALDLQPQDGEAQYGLGVALLQQGDREGGRRYLCLSLGAAGGTATRRREIASLLDHNGLACSP